LSLDMLEEMKRFADVETDYSLSFYLTHFVIP
jgi:hypothetical protein